jgi:hypothetical protein
LLAVIGSTYGAMGEPTGAVEIRLGQASRSDLFWAQQIYASRRAELRAKASGLNDATNDDRQYRR